MRVDKTLSELWNLKNLTDDPEVIVVVTMAINTIHKMDEEHDKFVIASYNAIRKEEEKVKHYEKALKEIESNVRVVNWKQSIKIAREALGGNENETNDKY